MKTTSIFSPNKKIEVQVSLLDYGSYKSVPHFSVLYKGTSIINESVLGLKIQNYKKKLFENWKIMEVKSSSHEEVWTPVYGERNSIPNNYNESTIELEQNNDSEDVKKIKIHMIFRVFDEGIGFKYHIPEQCLLKDITILNEYTQFKLPLTAWSYEEVGSEGIYKFQPISSINTFYTERPLTIVTNPDSEETMYMTITDANVYDYSPIRLLKYDEQSLRVNLGANDIIQHPGETCFQPKPGEVWDGRVKCSVPFDTAWKAIIMGDKPADLIEYNYLIENLCPPCAIEDPSWIKPGKVFREVKMTTKSGFEYVDFAVEHGVDYIHWDAGWYGNEHDMDADPTTISRDPKRYNEEQLKVEFDFHKVIKYAKENGKGIFVYVNKIHLEQHLDKIIPLYKKWGIDGIKFGFVRYGPHQCQKWLIDAVKKCADHQILVDIHDAFRPSGLSRTYPNLLTQEGIRGNEHQPTARHSCTLPFTRFCSGAGDFTISYYKNKIKTTRAHQIAISVIFYSPAQFLYWYDDTSCYKGEKELEFFKKLVTVWDDTKVIDGKIGEYVTIARRTGDTWFLGSITNEESQEKHISLDFLDKGKEYLCSMYYDDPKSDTRFKVEIKQMKVTSKDVIKHTLVETGGLGLIIEPN